MDVLLTPPIAFLAYIPLVLLIRLGGRSLAAAGPPTGMKTSLYGSGEAPPTTEAAPGYRPFLLIALFFAILHLGILVLGIGRLPVPSAAYIVGLLLALTALILG
jgi:hypothetical protein